GPGKAIDAAVLAAAKCIDRTVEADVGRAVAGQNRPWMLDRDRRAPPGHAVQCFDLVEPLAFDDPLLEVEARWGRIARRPASVTRLDWHAVILCRHAEH